MNLDWFPIFKGGKQTDSNGVVHSGDDLIEKAIKNFNTNKHQPPIVIGHPKDNAPAYGWISDIKKEVVSGVPILYAKAKDAVPEFIEWLKKGLYKTRSASFYPDGTLRHVGFLGAMPPAVKGLPNLFKEDEKYVLFEEDKNVKDKDTDNIIKGVIDGLKNMFNFTAASADKQAQQARSKEYGIAVKENNSNVTKPGEWANVADADWLDPVNYRYPVPDDTHIRNAAARWAQVKPGDYTPAEVAIINKRLDDAEKKAGIGKYKKGGTTNMAEKLEFTEQELQAKMAEVTEKAAKAEREKVQAEFAEAQKKAQVEQNKKEIKSFVEGLKKEGKLIPAWEKAGLTSFMESLNDASDPLEFAEGKKESKLEWFKNFLAGMDKIVDFKEIATPDKKAKDIDYGEFGGAVDEDRAEIDKKVKAYMKENKITNYAEALNKVLEMEA